MALKPLYSGFKKTLQFFSTQFQALEQFVVNIIYDRTEKDALGVFFLKKSLLLLSYLFSGLVQVRYLLYKNRILKPQPLGCRVIVVGNLTVGGTGKTPVVEMLAKALRDKGRNVAVLSRGYKSKTEPLVKKLWRLLSHGEVPPPKVVSDGQTIFLDSEAAGDEPYMLARNLPGVKVIVDKNRVKGGYYAIKRYKADTLILDDGFQYLPLKGWMHILLIDKTNPFGNGNLLPRGILREPIKHLKRASYVCITKSNSVEDPELVSIIQRYQPNLKLIECRHCPTLFKSLDGSHTLPLSAMQGKLVAVLSGIASPKSFESFLEGCHAILVHKEQFTDHHRFTDYELDAFIQAALKAKAEYLLLTEKDAVRLPKRWAPPLPAYYLRIEIDILKGKEIFEELVQKVVEATSC